MMGIVGGGGGMGRQGTVRNGECQREEPTCDRDSERGVGEGCEERSVSTGGTNL